VVQAAEAAAQEVVVQAAEAEEAMKKGQDALGRGRQRDNVDHLAVPVDPGRR
jgi:hypothetical protein